MQSITTRHIPPTDRLGARIKAVASGGLSLTRGWNHELDAQGNHDAIAKAFIIKYGWQYYAWFCSTAKVGGNVYVCAMPSNALTFSDTQMAWAEQSPRLKETR